MDADLLGRDPGQVLPEPLPKVVVAARRDRLAVSVPQDLIGWVVRAALVGVCNEVAHQGGRDGLPPHGFALLFQSDKALLDIEVTTAQGERAAATAGCLDVQPEQEAVQVR